MTESPEDPEPGRRAEEEIEVVSATATSHSLVFLDKFTQYRIQVWHCVDACTMWFRHAKKEVITQVGCIFPIIERYLSIISYLFDKAYLKFSRK